jgi:hypothetical protein
MKYEGLRSYLPNFNYSLQLISGLLVFLFVAVFPRPVNADVSQCPNPLPEGVTCQIVVYPSASSLNNPDFAKLIDGIDSLLHVLAYTLPPVWAVGIVRRIVVARL